MTGKDEYINGSDLKIEQREIMELWHIFSRVAVNGKRKMERELEQKGIKPIELRILYNLSCNGTTSMNSLSSENNVTGPWITGIVEEMEKKGYVSKDRNEYDRRMINVTILEKGKEMLSGGLGVYASLISTSLENLTQNEKEEFRKILLKIEDSLSK